MRTGLWYQNLKKSPLTPPPFVFKRVWAILYTLIFLSYLLILFSDDDGKVLASVLFLLQLGCNLLWPRIFFVKHDPLSTFILIVILWFLILGTIIAFWDINVISAIFLFPYILWTSFAIYLNYKIVQLNNY